MVTLFEFAWKVGVEQGDTFLLDEEEETNYGLSDDVESIYRCFVIVLSILSCL